MGFQKSSSDSSLFIHHHSRTLVYILVYVDYIIIIGSNSYAIKQAIWVLSSVFSPKDLGQLHYFLGVEVFWTQVEIILTQPKYVCDFLAGHNMSECKPIHTLMSSPTSLSIKDGTPSVDGTLYRQVVGKLQYLSFTRPDISFVVNKLS